MKTLEERYQQVCREWSDIQEHLPTLVEMVEALDAKRVIELGVRWGTSTIAWLYGLQKTAGHLWSVDVDHPSIWNDLVGHPGWTFIRGDDTEAWVLQELPEEVDIVFVDTSHRYEHTKREIELYAPRVRPGGALVFHDTAVKEFEHHEPGTEPEYPVREAVYDWLAERAPAGCSWHEYTNCYGLTVVSLPEGAT